MPRVYYETINPFGIHIIQKNPGKNKVVVIFSGTETTRKINIPEDTNIPVKKGSVVSFEEQESPNIKVLEILRIYN